MCIVTTVYPHTLLLYKIYPYGIPSFFFFFFVRLFVILTFLFFVFTFAVIFSSFYCLDFHSFFAFCLELSCELSLNIIKMIQTNKFFMLYIHFIHVYIFLYAYERRCMVRHIINSRSGLFSLFIYIVCVLLLFLLLFSSILLPLLHFNFFCFFEFYFLSFRRPVFHHFHFSFPFHRGI